MKNIEMWSCGIDPQNVKQEVNLALNRNEVKFLLHKLVFLRDETKKELSQCIEKLNGNISEEEKDSLNETINVCELDLMDFEKIIAKFVQE